MLCCRARICSIDSMQTGGAVVRNSKGVIIDQYSSTSNNAAYYLPSDEYMVTFELGGEKMKISRPLRPLKLELEFVDDKNLKAHQKVEVINHTKNTKRNIIHKSKEKLIPKTSIIIHTHHILKRSLISIP